MADTSGVCFTGAVTAGGQVGLRPSDPGGLVIRVLGGLAVTVDGVPVDVRGGLRRRLLLALLAAEERSVSVDALGEALWGPDASSDGGPNAVQAHVSRLRRLLDPSGERGTRWLASRPDGYLLHPDWLDLAAFEASVAGAAATSMANPAGAMAVLAEALASPSEPVQDDFGSWASLVRRFEQRRLGAEDAWADLAARFGVPADADRIVELARADPLREVRWALAMRALARSGRQVQALEVYDEARRLLDDDFGVEPGRELRLMHEAVLRQDPALAVDAQAAPRSSGFGLPHAATSFVGREDELRALDGLSASGRLVTLVGLGGVGKSRLAGEWVQRSGRAGQSRWVDLRGASAGEVGLRLASELGLAPQEADPATALDTVLAAATGLPELIILDNADGRIGEVASISASLIRAAPGLSLLITAPEPVGVPGERLLTLGPLPLGDGDRAGGAEVLAAARLEPGASQAEIRRVAEQASGVPLAIEVLAANPGAADDAPMGLAAIVRAAAEALPDDTARLFASLSCLPVGAPPSLSDDLAAGLARTAARRPRLLRELVGASLVVTTTTRGAAAPAVRHRVLQPVTQAAVWASIEDEERTFAVLDGWLRARTRSSHFEQPRPETAELVPELVTIETALSWWAERDPAYLIEATCRIHDFWRITGRHTLARGWLRRGLDAPGVDPLRRSQALVHLSLGGGLAGMAQALPELNEAIKIMDAEGVRSGPLYAFAHGHRAVARGWRGDLIGAHADLSVARSCSEAAGSEWFGLFLDLAVALSWAARLRPRKGIGLALVSARSLARLGDVDGATGGLYWASLLAGFARDDRIDAILAEAASLSADASPPVQALIAGEVAKRAVATGRPEAAAELASAIRLTERSGNLRTAAIGRRELGLVLLREGRTEAARYQLRLAAERLLVLDPRAGALAVGGLARAGGPTRQRLAVAAWVLVAAPSGTPTTAHDRSRLKGLVGPAPRSLPPFEVAVAAIREALASSESSGTVH